MPIQAIFGFYLLNETQCNQCKQVTHSTNLSYNLSVSLHPQPAETYQIEHKTQRVEVDFH